MLPAYIFFHYLTVTLIVALPILGVSRTQGKINSTTLDMLNQQPGAADAIRNIFFLGNVIIELTVIIGFLVGLMFGFKTPTSWTEALAHGGALFCVGFCGLVIGLLSAAPASRAVESVAREPFERGRVTNLALVAISMIQTPAIFGFILSTFILSQSRGASAPLAVSLLASGLTLGLGALGPLRGLSLFARQACASVGINKMAYSKIIVFTLVSQALIETPILFAFVTALLIVLLPIVGYAPTVLTGYKALTAAIAMALSTIGAGIGSGTVSNKACEKITLSPDQQGILSRTSILGQVFIDTNAIFGFIVALVILLFS